MFAGVCSRVGNSSHAAPTGSEIIQISNGAEKIYKYLFSLNAVYAFTFFTSLKTQNILTFNTLSVSENDACYV